MRDIMGKLCVEMKLNLVCTSDGFKPATDDDYEIKKSLKRGTVYECTIKEYRNYRFHKKYFSLINCAWEYLSEGQRTFFKEDSNIFRKTAEVASGFYEPCYSLSRNEWLEMPKSIAFDKMSEADFERLYERIKDVIYNTFIPDINKQEFEQNLKYY